MTALEALPADNAGPPESGPEIAQAESLFQRLQPVLAVAGITRVAVVTGLDVIGIPVVMVTRPLGRSLSVTQGKGPTLLEAKLSGIMEAMEHFHAEAPTLSLRYGSAAELLGSSSPLETTRREHDRAGRAAEPNLWTTGTSLIDGEPRWVPYDAVHLDMRLPGLARRSRLAITSNGLAAGDTLDGAVSHALFELIERHQASVFYRLDAVAQSERRLDEHSIADELCRALLSRYRAAGVALTLWDLSDGLGVPCFLCEANEARPTPFRLVPRSRGFGCHLDKRRALRSALCEAAQSRLTAICGVRDDLTPADLAQARQRESLRAARSQSTSPSGHARSFEDLPSYPLESRSAQVEQLIEVLSRAGMAEIIRVDLSRPGFPLCVVRMIVPGLTGYTSHHDAAQSRGAAR